MKPSETARLLGLAAVYDNRSVGELDVATWHDVVGDLDFEDAKTAVADWYREHRERIMPADVRTGVRRIRSDRLGNSPDPELDVDPDDVPAYLEALRESRRRRASGEQLPEVTAISDAESEANRRRLAGLTQGAFRQIGSGR